MASTMILEPVGLGEMFASLWDQADGIVLDLERTEPTASARRIARKQREDAEDSARLALAPAADYADLGSHLADLATGPVQVTLTDLDAASRVTVRLADAWGQSDADLADAALASIGMRTGAWWPNGHGLSGADGRWMAVIGRMGA